MSKAVVFSEYGPPEVLRVVDLPAARPGPGQVRVRVRAAGIQPFDNLFRSGQTAQWVPAHFPQQVGNEAAGVVDAIGPGVTEFAVGDEVLGWVELAAFAEHAVMAVDQLVAKPAGMPWEEAGALSASGQTAHTALRELAVNDGETVLVHAAAGGVGSIAVQLAVAWGATVIGTASERNHDYLRTLGAIPVTYGDGLAERVRALAPDGVHAALDGVATEDSLHTSLELVHDTHRVGTVAFNPIAQRLGVRRLGTQRSTDRLRELTALHTKGALKVAVHRTYSLDEIADAHREVETGHVRGKVVIVP
ncbi:NADP-dependent oxidoreductase [Kibdelosporangium phytohabitans]|uniref:Alcohol dehydrogenase n=1 Tax=Kibdelosporangium phytohabitans TaxID=860235 RepID=A0A0N7F3X5_9PSEU|nr:NADP-dependent oxidoreductase [Kibdelosporangium phytohabitans]ALG09847.1 alcohol dehydrogenase [Kibdelosporangium phytohabitans]MBE1468762.1 enoyl reductase [Kibdelosporangium phytohabitans]